MRVKIQNAWNKETKSFDRDSFNLRESEKVILGSFQMSKKDKATDKWLNSPAMNFVCFRKDVSCETVDTIINHGGKSFEVKGELMFDIGQDGKSYWKFKIDEASGEKISQHSVDKGNAYVSDEDPDSIPF